jgi:hypothetical protein
VLAIATTAEGEVRALQRTHLGADARKLTAEAAETRGYKAVKQSHGNLMDPPALVRLPGAPDKPLVIAEGIETGLSVWSCGFETWVALGGLGKLALPPGRKIAICQDDDAEHSPADKTLRRATAGWSQAGADFVFATPWVVRRHDRSDFNDILRVSGLEAVRERIEAALREGRPRLEGDPSPEPSPADDVVGGKPVGPQPCPPPFALPTLSAGEAAAALRGPVTAFVDQAAIDADRRLHACVAAALAEREPVLPEGGQALVAAAVGVGKARSPSP